MITIERLYDMKKSISAITSEFNKFDHVDKLLLLHLLDENKAWLEITSVVQFLVTGKGIRADLVLDELKRFKEYSDDMDRMAEQ